MKHRNLIQITLLVGIILAGCSIYAPFDGKSSSEDFLELAQKCLHDGDYDCAVSNYSSLPDGELKSEKLCTVYMAKGGMVLRVILSILNQNSSSVLGDLANTLVPWTAAKQADLATAKTHCAALMASNATNKTAVLLDSVSRFGHCAMLMAKSDQLVGSSDSDTVCTTAGNNTVRVTQSDIGGMCSTDVLTCNTDLSGVTAAQLTGANLGDMANALNAVPAAVRTTSTDTTAIRAALVTTAPSS